MSISGQLDNRFANTAKSPKKSRYSIEIISFNFRCLANNIFRSCCNHWEWSSNIQSCKLITIRAVASRAYSNCCFYCLYYINGKRHKCIESIQTNLLLFYIDLLLVGNYVTADQSINIAIFIESFFILVDTISWSP